MGLMRLMGLMRFEGFEMFKPFKYSIVLLFNCPDVQLFKQFAELIEKFS